MPAASATARPCETVLVTGCSSGIGEATAEAAARAGHRVIATAPTPEELERVPASAALRLVLDVTRPESVRGAVAEARRRAGPISVLVNNAGICQPGPIELLSDAQVARQLDVNLMGPIRVIREVLPDMRAARRGTIVNLSSLLGRVSLPPLGIYCASKYAVEAISDALRLELRGFGIRVVLIEPGWIRSNLAPVARTLADPAWAREGPYAPLLRASEAGERNLHAWEGTPADVARVIVGAFESRRPRARYPVTFLARLLPALSRWLPQRAADAVFARMLGSR
jgi:NAD(P)-dependent dehydrogenase (short-subunit alcohol dehydrogenase family)